MAKRNDYDESAIRVLKGLEPVQERPGMYTLTDNPNHIIQEVIDNAQDEALAGYANHITVELGADGSVTVEDNGRGIPTGIHPIEKRSTLEVVFTVLHAGGKFDKGSAQAYGFTGGLHGVGVSVTNALSNRLEVTVWRDGYEYTLAFENGAVVDTLKRTKLKMDIEKRGTRVKAYPNPKYFDSPTLSVPEMERYLRAKAVLMPGVKIEWIRPDKPVKVWDYPDGMAQYLREEVGPAEWVVSPMVQKLHYPDNSAGFEEGEGFDLAIGWLVPDTGRPFRESFVNLIPTPQGGRHETGLQAGSLEAIRNMAERLNLVPKGVKIEAGDVMGKVAYVLSVKLLDPQFQNQTKDRMTSEKGHRLVAGLWRDALELWLNDHLDTSRLLIDQIVQDAIHRTRAAVKTERRKTTGAMMLPGKLADCETKNVEESELYLVEGDSAGGCLTKNSQIFLTDGRNVNFGILFEEQELGIQNFCYTIKANGRIGVAPIQNVRLTKHKAPLVEVELDNGEKIKCTPCHQFMLRDGSYLRADKMISGQSLMPLNKKVFEEMNYGIKGIEFAGEEVSTITIKKWKEDKKIATRSVISIEKFLTKFCEGNMEKFKELLASYNHRVVAVRHLDYCEDVYDFEVPETHNFALAAGVFVHNSAKQGRDNQRQAILPLRGKLLNTWDVDGLKLAGSETIADISSAIGIQAHTLEDMDKVDMSRLRYGRICIMADADVDGQHIQVLLLTLFLRHFPALLYHHHIYIAQSPLYRVDAPPKKGKKVEGEEKGRRRFYALDDDELKEIQSELFREGVLESQITVNRFKGLGEMNPDQLWETTMNPESRRQLLIQVGDAKKAEAEFNKMMGSKNAKERKEWMEKDGGTVSW